MKKIEKKIRVKCPTKIAGKCKATREGCDHAVTHKHSQFCNFRRGKCEPCVPTEKQSNMTKTCDHFWEIVLPITNASKQKHKCMKCGIVENREMPIFNIDSWIP